MKKYLLKPCALLLSAIMLLTTSYTNASTVGAYTTSSQQVYANSTVLEPEMNLVGWAVGIAVGVVGGAYAIGTALGAFAYHISHDGAQASEVAMVLDTHESPTDFAQFDR
ncbi:hypothetical protein [Hymenobacter arizonensis]|uniref:Uncharacterized protein n=1 Tax=Hymenobacter arizonensis TaxID=1227077 RepID=A0A1I6BLB1_HYMAR|nr:hypothetical protein [Hymenobacter arizonensis]SFQ81701.1 hypothetical protein SAMN04515668_4714 [Hymenobacter arizonensis]